MSDRAKLSVDAIQTAAHTDIKAPVVKMAHFSFTYAAEKNLRKRAKTAALRNDITLSKFMEQAVEMALDKYKT